MKKFRKWLGQKILPATAFIIFQDELEYSDEEKTVCFTYKLTNHE